MTTPEKLQAATAWRRRCPHGWSPASEGNRNPRSCGGHETKMPLLVYKVHELVQYYHMIDLWLMINKHNNTGMLESWWIFYKSLIWLGNSYILAPTGSPCLVGNMDTALQIPSNHWEEYVINHTQPVKLVINLITTSSIPLPTEFKYQNSNTLVLTPKCLDPKTRVSIMGHLILEWD